MSRLAALALALLASTAALAHDFSTRDVRVAVRADGTYRVEVSADVDALALGASPATDDAELVAAIGRLTADEREHALDRARDTLARRVKIRFDGTPVRAAISFPGDATEDDERPSVFGTIARLEGDVPAGARELVVAASRAFGVIRLSVEDERLGRGTTALLAPGERGPPWRLDAAPLERPSRLAVAGRYVRLGFDHILPRGIDHVLFVLGLFLLAARWRPLVWQVSAFTLAHTVTLGLSVAGVVALPARVVEPLIALSIAYVAIENLCTERLHPWRPALVFGFGLLHGLGFASVLRELGLPDGEWPTALISFNIGVELGQLAVLGLAFVTIGLLRERAWYRARVVVPCSVAIALVGLYWAVERAVGS